MICCVYIGKGKLSRKYNLRMYHSKILLRNLCRVLYFQHSCNTFQLQEADEHWPQTQQPVQGQFWFHPESCRPWKYQRLGLERSSWLGMVSLGYSEHRWSHSPQHHIHCPGSSRCCNCSHMQLEKKFKYYLKLFGHGYWPSILIFKTLLYELNIELSTEKFLLNVDKKSQYCVSLNVS